MTENEQGAAAGDDYTIAAVTATGASVVIAQVSHHDLTDDE